MARSHRHTQGNPPGRARILRSACAISAGIALAGIAGGMMGCRASTESDHAPARADSLELPAVPPGFREAAPFADVEPLATANENFGRAYREEEAAVRASDESEQVAHLLLALAYRHHGLQLSPHSLTEHERFQMHLASLAQVEPVYGQRLLGEYRAWWHAAPDDPRACYLFGRALALTNHMTAADAVLRRGLQRAPHDYWLNVALGTVAWQREDLDTAVTHLKVAVREGERLGQFGATRALGHVYASIGQFDAAAEQLATVLGSPTSVKIEDFELLARCLMELGRYDDAEQVLLGDMPPLLSAQERGRHLRTVGDLFVRKGDYESAHWAYSFYLERHADAPDRRRVEQALQLVEHALRSRRDGEPGE